MRALVARTSSRLHAAHTPRALYRIARNGTLSSKPPPTPSTPPAPDDQPEPQKTYARLPDLPTFTLSQPKLRALIDLYHSSSTFITPETLSDEIDKTFAPIRFNQTLVRPDSYQILVERRDERAAAPDRVVPTANEMEGAFAVFDTLPGGSNEGWSESKGERARMVKGALWGVDPMGKIGLETLLEAKAEMDQFTETEGRQVVKEDTKTGS
ncbi:hypothetical protein FRC09_014264 [Ceratobasidium sp. 395]|nr:hypothetical protein FRC09_014264 [Ceratobasidium sp. 395]